MSTAAGVGVRSLRQGVAIVEQGRSWAGQVHRGPCLIGRNTYSVDQGGGCQAVKLVEPDLAVPCARKAGRTIPGRPSPRTPFLVAAGFTGSGTLCIPPLTVGDPTLRFSWAWRIAHGWMKLVVLSADVACPWCRRVRP